MQGNMINKSQGKTWKDKARQSEVRAYFKQDLQTAQNLVNGQLTMQQLHISILQLHKLWSICDQYELSEVKKSNQSINIRLFSD